MKNTIPESASEAGPPPPRGGFGRHGLAVGVSVLIGMLCTILAIVADALVDNWYVSHVMGVLIFVCAGAWIARICWKMKMSRLAPIVAVVVIIGLNAIGIAYLKSGTLNAAGATRVAIFLLVMAASYLAGIGLMWYRIRRMRAPS